MDQSSKCPICFFICWAGSDFVLAGPNLLICAKYKLKKVFIWLLNYRNWLQVVIYEHLSVRYSFQNVDGNISARESPVFVCILPWAEARKESTHSSLVQRSKSKIFLRGSTKPQKCYDSFSETSMTLFQVIEMWCEKFSGPDSCFILAKAPKLLNKFRIRERYPGKISFLERNRMHYEIKLACSWYIKPL